jgi:hypothetical protein
MARVGDVGVVVIDVLTGKPIADVPIRVRSSGGDEIGAEHTDDRGTESFEQLPSIPTRSRSSQVLPRPRNICIHWQDEGSEYEQLTGDYAGNSVERPSRRHRRRAG